MDNSDKIEEIKKLYQEGKFKDVLWKKTFLPRKNLPQELNPILIDSCIQNIFTNSPDRTNALIYLGTELKDYLKTSDRERIILAILMVITDPKEKYPEDIIRRVDIYDDPRILEALVEIYKHTQKRGLKMAITFALHRMGKEKYLSILLDYFFAHNESYSGDREYFLTKYPILQNLDASAYLDSKDRDKLVNILLSFLQENEPFIDNLEEYTKFIEQDFWNNRENAAFILGILYASEQTSFDSKGKIKANKGLRINWYLIDAMYEHLGCRLLMDYVQFESDK